MNTFSYFYVSTCLGMGLLMSYQISDDQTARELTFIEAVNKGYISCKSTGAGGFSGKTVNIDIVNKTTLPLNITITPGTLFYPSDNGQQTLITVENQLFSLKSKEHKNEAVFAYCSEHSDRSPNTSSTFTVGKNKNLKFDSLFTFMKGMKIPTSSHQSIVWAISDNSPVSAVGSETRDLKKLRKYLFKVTKQEEEDFTSDYILTVDDQGFIHKTLYQIKGFIEFESDKTKWLHQEVYDENGKLKFKGQQAFEIPRGKSDYSFNIIVKTWEKGTYTMKLKNGNEVVETYPFKV